MAKKNDDHSGGLAMYPDGHWLLNGARWHTPKQGIPTECEIKGCDYPLGAWRNYDALDGIEANPPDDDEGTEDASVAPVPAASTS